ncbi:MAG: 4-hydroxy-3-methylbut-2-enyl diphosphate reductase, partial [Eggerthellaceae bacterium]|nr:4-hydroxy-3-methylbut-2-enyl diphosphate reductase [Eggerthellaceae bacterium]
GIECADSVKDIEDAPMATVIVRSHGTTPQTLKAAKGRGLNVIDATCPHVARAQRAAASLAKQGCHLIGVGEAGHPEVEAIRQWALEAGGQVDVVADPEDLPEGLHDPVGVVVQTTQRRENLERIKGALRDMGLNPVIKDTICQATALRQQAAAKLAKEVDVMLVIGGRNSSKTTRLIEICEEACQRTYHVESTNEIERSWLENAASGGITAGASTPEDQIRAIEDYLLGMD